MKKYLFSTYSYDSTGKLQWVYPQDDLRYNARAHYSGAILIVLLPLRRMAKNFIDTFKPYKDSHQRKDDYKHFITGSALVLMGLAITLFYPFYVARSGYGLLTKGKVKPFVISTFIIPLQIATTLLCGLTRIATSPLALLRIPFRSLITYVIGAPKIEDNAGIKSLAKKGEMAAIAGHSTGLIDLVLRQKIKKASQRGQDSQITEVQGFLNNSVAEAAITYKTFLLSKSKTNTKVIATSSAREETQTTRLDIDAGQENSQIISMRRGGV
jgi:hypothetical protein